MKENKKIKEKLERLIYIKEVIYGYGIPPKNSPFWEDIKKLKRYND